MRCTPYVLAFAFFLVSFDATSQARVRRLSTIINHPSLNIYAPYISSDANALVYLTDNAEDNALTPFFSFRDRGDWKDPQVLPKNVNTRLSFLRGYSLNSDGTHLYFSTLKTPGVGGFDLWLSEWKGAWANPVNLGGPINSKLHEACASLTPDGRTLYFMRCAKMDQNKADQCILFRVDKKSNGIWGEPVELPANINTGNSQVPRIMADAETLIFSSDKMGSTKGGMDLYVTRLQDGNWTDPVALEFVNTAEDDQYVSVTGLGRYLLRDSPGQRKNELVEYLIPDHLRPRGMMKIDGKVADAAGAPLQPYVSLVNLHSGERIYNGRPNSDGTFLLYAMEGSRYELSIDPAHGNKTYYSKVFDLTREPIPQVEKVTAVLKALEPGDEFELSGISFLEHSGDIDMSRSQRELQRVTRMVTSNPDYLFEVNILFEGYEEDSVQSHPGLTEVRMDTVHWKYVEIDTLGQLYEKDTASVSVTYHNDKSFLQAQAVVDYLISRGANEGSVAGFSSAMPALIAEDKKTLVRIRVLKK